MIKNILKIVTVSLFSSSLLAALPSAAQSNIDYVAFPPTNAESATPLVMLTMSRDHQYFFKAYNDFTDLDPENNNGVETTYSNSVEYYGYFQSNVCYSYSNADGRFVPEARQINTYYCNGGSDNVAGEWSGNFLNWATMTRMDIIRKLFYGGKRVTDTGTTTVLERAYLPPDAHAFAKYYNGDDIDKLTPVTGIVNDGDGINEIDEGLTICNVTQFNSATINSGSTDPDSQLNTSPPVIRMARGNYSLWASNERFQCAWGRGSNDNNTRNVTVGGVDTGDVTYNGVVYARGDVIPDVSSGVFAEGSAPGSSDSGDAATDNLNDQVVIGGDRDVIVRVRACVSDGAGGVIDNADCQQYDVLSASGNVTSTSFKPTGILQEFGETELIHFGLMTGSYTNNTSGGALRKQISSFSDEVNSDGTFDRTVTGGSIVNFLDAVRIFGYRYGSTSYTDCGGNRDLITDSPCRAWGNPISEIYRDSVLYIAGEPRPAHADVQDSNFIASIDDSENWNSDVITTDNQCAALSSIVINGSVSTHDNDPTFIDIGAISGGNTDVFTNQIGTAESISGGNFFIGDNGTVSDQLCSAKTLTDLSDAIGLCPEGPSKQGGYALAGIAKFARETDLKPGVIGEQNLTTYGIALASSNPVIEVPRDNDDLSQGVITIIPAGRQFQGSSGAIVNFVVIQPHTQIFAGDDKYFGKFLVSYEVSVAGNDFDTDASGTIEYLYDESDGTITITTTAMEESAGSTAGLFGFIINGTTQDGFHAYSGDRGGNVNGASGGGTGGANYISTVGAIGSALAVPGCTDCRSLDNTTTTAQFGPRSHTFYLGSASASQLESPLFYASKYGGYEDLDNTTGLSTDEEWDRRDNQTGALLAGGDGQPDNYFFVTNPTILEESLRRTLLAILSKRQSSGTAPANLANADGSAGLIVQALFFESLEGEELGETVDWTGELQTYFIDDDGFFREDGNQNGQLDSTAVDNVFVYSFDQANQVLNVQRYRLQNDSIPFNETVPVGDPERNELVSIGGPVDATELNVIWSASESLASLSNASIDQNRVYSSPVGTSGASRYIFTWVDRNNNGEVDNGEEIPFERGQVTANTGTNGIYHGLLGFTTGVSSDLVEQGENVVDFIRGKDEIPGLRSRKITENSSEVVKRLGDIVNSTPVIVGPPSEVFDVTFGDATYKEYRNQYNKRRNVVYVGGNDGLLHAFNAGFRETSTSSSIIFSETGPGSETAHPLGAELWAYAPYNLMPHYRWLSEPTYSHVFYMDGEPLTFDVNIFDDDATHPGGWGTILVVGMRLGGGEYDLGYDNNGDTTDEVTLSSYVVLDITDPEQPPVLLGEINHPDLHHTTSRPTVVRNRVPGLGFDFSNPVENSWSLVFGSGPENRLLFSTNNDAVAFKVDLTLSGGRIADTEPLAVTVPVEESRSFTGSFTATDWNNDFVDDVVYFGTVQAVTTGDTQSGSLFRFFANELTPSVNLLMDVNRPMSTSPLTEKVQGQNFVYAGSGRFLHQADAVFDEQEVYVGIKEELTGYSASYTLASLLDITNVDVFKVVDANGNVSSELENLPALTVPENSSFEEFQQHILTEATVTGWKRLFNVPGGGDPSERVSSDSVSIRTQLIFNTFTPEEDICSPTDGTSDLYAVDLVTGTASSFGALGFVGDPDDSAPSSRSEARTSVDLGAGRASSPSVFVGAGGDGNSANVLSQSTTGKLNNTKIKLGDPIDLKRINWREIIQ